MKLHFTFTWKRILLVLFLAPVLGYSAILGVNKLLEPTPRYTLRFKPGEAKAAFDWGDFLFVAKSLGQASKRSIYHLANGEYICDCDLDVERKQPLPNTNGLPHAPNRYQLSRYGYFKSDDDGPLLHDSLSGKSHRFFHECLTQGEMFRMNRAGTFCVVNRAVPGLIIVPPYSFPSMFHWLADWMTYPYYRGGLYLNCYWTRVITVPDMQEKYSTILDTRVTAISPSGRWLAIASSSADSASEKTANVKQFVRLVDTEHKKVYASSDLFDQQIGDLRFLDEGLLSISLRTFNKPETYAFIHVPTRRLIEKLSGEDMAGHTPEFYRVAAEQNPFGFSYVKVDAKDQTSKTLSGYFVDVEGNRIELGRHTFLLNVVDQKAARGGQLFYYGDHGSGYPIRLESYLDKNGRLFRLFLSWYYRRYIAVYDWRTGQDAMHWSGKWYGQPSHDGSLLVMCENAEDTYLSGGTNDLHRIMVYDLPLPVWSPWWSRGAGLIIAFAIAMGLLSRIVLLPRNGKKA